jgi:NAD(P)-dependent dehydrogenase (short-subunit alcohol dehydrogenase family)
MRPKTLILAVRNAEKGEEAKKLILAAADQLHRKRKNVGMWRWLWPGFWFSKDKSNDGKVDEDDDDDDKVDLQVWPLDLTSFDSVKEFADRANKELDRLDILVENAGVLSARRSVTQNGWENT